MNDFRANTIQEANKKLEKLASKKFELTNKEMMIEVVVIITELIAPDKVSDAPIVVGGLSVEIYTSSQYTTRDIDFVSSSSMKIRELLLLLNFKKEGHIFYNEQLEIAVDIVDSHLAGEYSRVNIVEYTSGEFYLISLEDIILDRLDQSEHEEPKEWGFRLLIQNLDSLDLDYIRNEVMKKDMWTQRHYNDWLEMAISAQERFSDLLPYDEAIYKKYIDALKLA